MTLWQIDSRIEECFDPETGEIFADKLEALDIERRDKIEGILLGIKNRTATAKAIREEEKALADRRKSIEREAESMTRYIQSYLNGEKFSTTKAAVKWRASQVVEIDDIKVLPEDFLRYKDPEPDKTAIKDAIKKGDYVPGAHLEDKLNMSIV